MVDKKSYQRGLEAYERSDYDAALHEWRPLAEQGVAEAQYRVGEMYSSGEGLQVDDTEAEKWTRKAAEQVLAKAEHMLGDLTDGVEAEKWHRKAAEQGLAEAQYMLGVHYWYREEDTFIILLSNNFQAYSAEIHRRIEALSFPASSE